MLSGSIKQIHYHSHTIQHKQISYLLMQALHFEAQRLDQVYQGASVPLYWQENEAMLSFDQLILCYSSETKNNYIKTFSFI